MPQSSKQKPPNSNSPPNNTAPKPLTSNSSSPSSKAAHKNRMNNFKRLIAPLTLLAAMSLALATPAQTRPEPPPTSVASSPPSVTPASKSDGFSRSTASAEADRKITDNCVSLTAACNAAADDLQATRELVTALEHENALLKS